MDARGTQRAALGAALREARAQEPFEGVGYVRGEYRHDRVGAIAGRVNERPYGVKRLQPKLHCPLCRYQELVFYELRAR